MVKGQLKVIKAKYTGFCFGVRRAIGIAEKFLKENKTAYSIGPIIHNPAVVKELSQKGLTVIDDIKIARGKSLVIRSHGISPGLREKAKRLSINLIDATCPFVSRSHSLVGLLKNEGYKIIIIGERRHPEIRALSEVCGRGCNVVANNKEIRRLRLNGKKVALVAQTTLSRDDFLKMAHSLLNRESFEYRIFNTICNDVTERQAEIKRLAGKRDVILVVGGKMSANTRHLARIARNEGVLTYHIETERDLDLIDFRKASSVGVTSGASTSNEIVDKVVLRLKSMQKGRQKNVK